MRLNRAFVFAYEKAGILIYYRNYGLGEMGKMPIDYKVNPNHRNEFTITVGKHTASVSLFISFYMSRVMFLTRSHTN